MRTFALFGIDVYLKPRLITVARAENIVLAAKRLGGEVAGTLSNKRPDHRFCFVEKASSGVFKPGVNTARILATTRVADGLAYSASNAIETLQGYKEFQLGEIPTLD